MRVVILYNTSWYVYLLRRNLIAALRSAGCTVTVIAPRDAYTERVKKLGVDHVHLPLHPSSTNPLDELRTIRSLYGILRDLRPDAVLSYTIKCNLYAGLCRKLLNFRLIPNISGLGEGFAGGGSFRTFLRALYRTALGDCSRIFFQNGEDLAACASAGLIREDLCEVLPGSGVNVKTFIPSEKPCSDARTFLMMGRLLPAKGFRYFLRAAETLHGELGDRGRFWVLGAADSERSESLALLEEIHAAHARGTIRYLDKTDDALPILQECDVVVLPSTYNEGVPRSLLEAIACGKPVVTTDWKGCRETVRHAENGYLVPPHNQNELTRTLYHLATCPREELEALGRESRKLAVSRFDESIVIDAYARALRLNRIRKSATVAPLEKTFLTNLDARHATSL